MNKLKNGFGIITLILLLSASLTIAYYNRHDAFVYISLLWFLGCLAVVLASKSNMRLLALYTGTAIFTFGLYETYLAGWFSEQPPDWINFSISDSAYFQTHKILGTVPKKDIRVIAQKSYGNEVFYNVEYTIDKNGLRRGFDHRRQPETAILFFGGSFTFGEGVDDDETMPYRIEEKGGFKAFNFGFHGYGPHQMLAVLENNLEQTIVSDASPEYAVYQAIFDHVARCAGRAWWDRSGPQYLLNEKGEAIYQGPFQNFLIARFTTLMTRSNFVRKWLSSRARRISIVDIDLFVNIVDKSRNLFEERYGGEFYVLLWPSNSHLHKKIFSKLKSRQIFIIKVEDILSDVDKYRIRFPYENHPNKSAHEKIADHLVKLFRKSRSRR